MKRVFSWLERIVTFVVTSVVLCCGVPLLFFGVTFAVVWMFADTPLGGNLLSAVVSFEKRYGLSTGTIKVISVFFLTFTAQWIYAFVCRKRGLYIEKSQFSTETGELWNRGWLLFSTFVLAAMSDGMVPQTFTFAYALCWAAYLGSISVKRLRFAHKREVEELQTVIRKNNTRISTLETYISTLETELEDAEEHAEEMSYYQKQYYALKEQNESLKALLNEIGKYPAIPKR